MFIENLGGFSHWWC